MRGLQTSAVHKVITSHGHPDHFGNANYFPYAQHYFGQYCYSGNIFTLTQLDEVFERVPPEKILFFWFSNLFLNEFRMKRKLCTHVDNCISKIKFWKIQQMLLFRISRYYLNFNLFIGSSV